MVQNDIAVYIDGINLTRYVVMPLKWANLLDEQLDEAVLSLRNCPKKVITPLTPVEIRINNSVIMGKKTVYKKTLTKYMIVADQPDSTENPVGSKRYDHNLNIIEVTKLLERLVVDSITYTNVNSKIFTANPTPMPLNVTYTNGALESDYTNYYKGQPANFVTPLQAATNLFVPSWNSVWTLPSNIDAAWQNVNITAYDQNGNQLGSTTSTTSGFTITVPTTGACTIVYTGQYSSKPGLSTITRQFPTLTYTFTAVENLLPLKKWTIADVINRLLDVAEPIRQGETPQFTFNAQQAALFDNILAPQFSFTKQTLRECLQEVGGVVHGEPRLNVMNDGGGWYYEISYDLYGGTSISQIATRPYIKETVKQVIESYCTHIDTSAENLVNALGESLGSFLNDRNGVITEPYDGGYKTVRCDMLYSRISEENMLIQTQLPIYSIEKVECGWLPGGGADQPIDITPYVFEASVYNSRLSSYQSNYPYSKAYGLMYTQGEKNITALNFKQDNPISPVFEDYAIVNILKEATGNNTLDFSSPTALADGGYPVLAFRVTYTPLYSARVAQTKPNITDFPRGSALIYNQGSNVIESRYYGENLKGVIARLGNVEKTLTYHLSRLGHIPKAGQKYDDDYYISAVNVELFLNLINVTIGLSKDFNRLSQYIGISSTKRFSEVSQTQALERNVLYREYIVIGDSINADVNGSLLGFNFMDAIAATFVPSSSSSGFQPLTNVVAWGTTAQGNALPVVQLPVISSAFGNSISFEWAYEDNYSAGAISQYQSVNGVSGYFQNNYQYTDYYGKIYYYNFDLQPYGTQPTSLAQQTEIGLALPKYGDGTTPPTTSSGYISTIGQTPYIMRKDNREIIKVNMQVDFVTNRKGIIIGSALASNNPLICGNSIQAAKLYVFTDTLDKFINHLAGSVDVDFISQNVGQYTVQLPDLPSAELTVSALVNGQFTVSVAGNVFPGESGTQYKAWAIVTPAISQSEQVEDEEGNVTTQTVQYGGDVLIAQNINFSAGDTFSPIYFSRKREVFDKSVWKTAL